ncbi:MAG: hypothetical protein R3B82_10145 [Sandaracinaceae bacterium]
MKAALAFVLCFAPALASAQIAGVAADALTPAGMTRVEVEIPERETDGVWLYFAPEGATRATLRAQVYVAPSAQAARDAEALHAQSIAGDLDALSGLGDRASGGASMLTFVRDNVFVVLQRLGGQLDCRPAAHAIDAALRAAPRGPATTRLAVEIPMLVEGTNALQLPAAALGAHVVASGSAAARRARDGWVVTRRGGEAWSVTVLAADAMLRRVRVERTGS